MLPYIAAAWHNLYTKSVRLYLQSMSSLQTDYPDVYRNFEALSHHVVRRSNCLWARTIDGSCQEKPKDKWWFDERMWND